MLFFQGSVGIWVYLFCFEMSGQDVQCLGELDLGRSSQFRPGQFGLSQLRAGRNVATACLVDRGQGAAQLPPCTGQPL